MIIEEMARQSDGFRRVIARAHIVQVPLELAPWDGTGFLWVRAEEQDALVPRSTVNRNLVWMDWCRPAFPSLVFFNQNERGCLVVQQLPRGLLQACPGLSVLKMGAEEMRRFHPEISSTAPLPPLIEGKEASWGFDVWQVVLVKSVVCAMAQRSFAWEAEDGHTYSSAVSDQSLLDQVASPMNRFLGSPIERISRNRTPEDFELDRNNVMLSCQSALALLNCKNIRQEPAQRRRQERREARRRSLPFFQYHILMLTIPRQRGSLSGGEGEPLALHWMRGHFKDYREKGLFGKLRGVYWWSPHLAGQANRIVSKDYDATRLRKKPPEGALDSLEKGAEGVA